MVEFWTDCLDRHGADVRAGVSFQGLRREGETFEVESSDGPIRCRHVLLALGRRGTPRQLGVPGEQDERVLYQLVDATTYRSLRLLVVGGGDSAIEAALALASQPGNQVTLSYRKSAFFRAKKRNLDRVASFAQEGRIDVVFSSTVASIGTDTADLKLEDDSVRVVQADYLFVFAGGNPPYPLLEKIGVGMGPAT